MRHHIMNDRRSKHARSNCFLSIHSFLVEVQTNAGYIHATHVWRLGLQFPLVACNRPCTWNSVTPGNIHTHPTESHWTFLRGRGLGNWQTQMEFPGGVGGGSKVQTNNPLKEEYGCFGTRQWTFCLMKLKGFKRILCYPNPKIKASCYYYSIFQWRQCKLWQNKFPITWS